MIDLRWLAGLFDGEGCITINRRGNWYTLIVQIKLTDHVVLEEIHSVFGGMLTEEVRPLFPNRKRIWIWRQWAAGAIQFLDAIAPLHIKQDQAKLAKVFVQTLRDKNGSKQRLSQEELDSRQYFYEQMRLLKK